MPLTSLDIQQALISREEGLKNHLPYILNAHSQDESTEKAVINAINRLTATAKHRKDGLECLSQVIGHCSPATVRDNAFAWVELCVVKFPDDVLRELKLRLLGEIVKVCYKETDFNRRFVSNYLSKVFDNCLTTVRVNPYECKAALNTLTIVMKTYPSWFGVYKEKIEAFILIFLDNSDQDLVQAAAKAFHYLQQVGGAGSNGENHKSNFTNTLHKLCNTFHSLYCKLVENYTFSEPNSSEGPQYNFQNSLDDLRLNSQRIRNIFEFLQTMIRTGFPVAKEVKPTVLLKVVSTALSFHKCLANSEPSVDDYKFAFVLLQLQATALKFLRLLLIWLKTNSLPFSYQISRLIVESVERSRGCSCYKFDSFFKESAFLALDEWLTISKSALHPQFQARLLDVILGEITPSKSQITLTISELELSGKKSEKARRKAMTQRIISGGKETANQNVTSTIVTSNLTALTALTRLLKSTNLAVKPTQLKDLYRSVFDTLLDLQHAHPQSQAKLYEVLTAFYQQNVTVLPPLHTAIALLRRGVNGQNRFVASACAEGLRVLEGICQPVCPSLCLRVEDEGVGAEDPFEEAAGNANFRSNHDNFNIEDTEPEVVPYQVRYTESDRSTIEDGLSDKGGHQNDLSIEEVTEEAPDVSKHDRPIVTAPSEDGNEVLEENYPETLEAQQEAAPIVEEPAAQTTSKEEETEEGKPREDATVNSEGTEAAELEKPNEDDLQKEDQVEVDCQEPEAKKPRLSEDKSQEEEAKDPDDSYLEDDSFVDAVKNYY